MHGVNDWVDIGRILMMLMSLWCLYTLIKSARKNRHGWNVKTKDYSYVLLMWTLVGFALPLQGILLDRPLTPVFVIAMAAVLVTGKGLHKKGSWGGSDS